MTRNKRIEAMVRERLAYSNIDTTTTELLVTDISSFVRSEIEKEDKMTEDGVKTIFNVSLESATGEFMVIDLLSRIQKIAIKILNERGCPPVVKSGGVCKKCSSKSD